MIKKYYMRRAIKLAKLGRFTTPPNPNVGCVIVKEDKIIGEGYHYMTGKPHAETYALDQAKEKAKGATAYITLEPCIHTGHTPPCCNSLISAGIRCVVVSVKDPNPKVSGKGLRFLKKSGIEVYCGLMEREAIEINKGFFKRMTTGLPYIQLKMAMSLDGKTAIANGDSKWITSQESRSDVQKNRAKSCAILTTSETILSDDPLLNVRWNELDNNSKKVYSKRTLRQPLRVVVDRLSKVLPKHRVIQQCGITYIFSSSYSHFSWPENVKLVKIGEVNNHLDIMQIIVYLAKINVNTLWIECGPRLSGALLKLGLVDELVIYVAPKLLGNDSQDLFILPKIKHLNQTINFTFDEVHPIGKDLRICLLPYKNTL